MAKKVDLQERLNMRFLTVAYKDKQELYGTCCESADTGKIALDILNLPDPVLEELLELTDPMMELVDYLNKHRNPDNKTLSRMMMASKNVFRAVDLLQEVPSRSDTFVSAAQRRRCVFYDVDMHPAYLLAFISSSTPSSALEINGAITVATIASGTPLIMPSSATPMPTPRWARTSGAFAPAATMSAILA